MVLKPSNSFIGFKLKKKMKTEDKRGLPKIRIAVVGQANVGKSALTVRFLTGRYIGEYSSDTDLLYRQTVRVPNTNISADVEIVDICSTCSDDNEEIAFPEEAAFWADAVAVVYSITSRSSFTTAISLLQRLKSLRGAGVPTLVVANKADLGHLRSVSAAEGRAVAVTHGALFSEASAADGAGAVSAFGALLGATGAKRKFSVTRMLVQLVGNPQPAPSRGTVSPCVPSDLHRRRLNRRRETTVSL